VINLLFRDAWNNPKVNIEGKGRSKYKDAGGNIQWVDIKPWKPADLRGWYTDFVASAQKYWDAKLYLITPSSYRGFDVVIQSKKYRPNVWCRFDLKAVKSADKAHYVIDVANIKEKNAYFRSHSVLYDSNDKANTMRHEVGHLIGLAHPGGHSNAKAAYDDVVGFPDDVMGKGAKINIRHARPWCMACAWLTDTKADSWVAHTEFQKPKPIK
jgi:hypothetical protein